MFIVLEGIDGAGKGRQRIEITSLLDGRVKELHSIDFPDHQGVLYNQIIHPALHEEVELTKSGWFLSFALDQVLWQEKLKKAKQSKTEYYIVDGYYTTNIVYQSIVNKYFSLESTLEFARMFEIVEPDLTVFIDVDPEVAMARKMNEEGHDEGLDINERSITKQNKIQTGFKHMVDNQIFGKWESVDGNKSIEEVRDQIMAVLESGKYI